MVCILGIPFKEKNSTFIVNNHLLKRVKYRSFWYYLPIMNLHTLLPVLGRST